jgi:hypothetical protein
MHRTILDAHSRKPLQFSPVTRAEAFFEKDEIADLFATRDGLDSADLSDDLERLPDVHGTGD